MQHFFEVKINGKAVEMPVHRTMERILDVVHGFVRQRGAQGAVGVSFPGYTEGARRTLGDRMRIFSNDRALLEAIASDMGGETDALRPDRDS